eukprot:COSAG06_NODE_14794_length_1125_cov_1.534113_1_plen_144_part_10
MKMDRKALAHRRAEDFPATSVEIVCGVSQSNEQVSPRKPLRAGITALSIMVSNTYLQTSRDRLHLRGGAAPISSIAAFSAWPRTAPTRRCNAEAAIAAAAPAAPAESAGVEETQCLHPLMIRQNPSLLALYNAGLETQYHMSML